MNASEKFAGRGSGRKGLGAIALVLAVAVLASACVPGGGSPPPKDDGDDRTAAPPGHFVLSITPVQFDPGPTLTITIPPTYSTQVPTSGPPPTDTRPPLTGTVVPTSIPIDPTTPHPTIWDPPPVDDDPAGDGDVVETIPNHTVPKTTIPDTTVPDTTIPSTTVPDELKPKRVVLACNPDAGTHPDPTGACTSLRKVNGYFEKLPPDPAAVCIEVYAPVRVEAIGYWGTRQVKYTETFSNDCIAAAETDFVFRF